MALPAGRILALTPMQGLGHIEHGLDPPPHARRSLGLRGPDGPEDRQDVLRCHVLGRQIAEPVQALVAPALAIGRGETATLPPPALRETAEVATALAHAQELLLQREQSRLSAETALRDSQSRLRMALDISRIGTWELDLQTQQITRSQPHDECFGYTEPVAEWDFEKFFTHVHSEDRAWVRRDFAAARSASRRRSDSGIFTGSRRY